jgi:uncharacterized membrane protein YhiD involved in acid resistance
MQSIKDFLKYSEDKLSLFGKISTADIAFCLVITALIAMFIFFIYKLTYKGAVYNHSFNVSLVLMSVITAVILLAVSSNLVLSLGMVGALSIIRFRTAIKDPIDIVFLFWAISAGIACGAGLFPIAILGSIFIAILLLLLTKFKVKDKNYILVINYNEKANDAVRLALSKLKYTIKSKAVRNGHVELTLSLRIKDDNTSFVSRIASIEAVDDAVLLGYNGDYAE